MEWVLVKDSAGRCECGRAGCDGVPVLARSFPERRRRVFGWGGAGGEATGPARMEVMAYYDVGSPLTRSSGEVTGVRFYCLAAPLSAVALRSVAAEVERSGKQVLEARGRDRFNDHGGWAHRVTCRFWSGWGTKSGEAMRLPCLEESGSSSVPCDHARCFSSLWLEKRQCYAQGEWRGDDDVRSTSRSEEGEHNVVRNGETQSGRAG